MSGPLPRALVAALLFAGASPVHSAEPDTASVPPRSPAAAPAPPAADRDGNPTAAPGVKLRLKTTSVVGNQQLPKVLYIVPWHAPEHGEVPGLPANTLLRDVLRPLDREVFLRQLDYYQALFGESAGPAG